MKSEWILCKDRLPPCNKFVLGYFPSRPWVWTTGDGEELDPKYVVVIRQQGISKAEREVLSDNDERKEKIYAYDEHGNNKVPYNWKSFGPSSFFGQDCEAWMEIPVYKNAKTYSEKKAERNAKCGEDVFEKMSEEMNNRFYEDMAKTFVKLASKGE